MNQFTLWLNVISFATLAAAVGLLFIAHTRARRRWLVFLMLYTGGYGAWLLFGTYAYFQATFLPEAPAALGTAFAYVRAAMSFFILWAGSVFYLQLAGERWKTRTTGIVVIIGMPILVGVVLVLGYGMTWSAHVSTTLYNLYFCWLSGLALRSIQPGSGAATRVRPLLFYSLFAYGLLSVTSVVFALAPPAAIRGIPVNVFATGGFTLFWALVTLIIAVRWISTPATEEGMTGLEPMVTDFGLSPREAEIVLAARTGRTSREIGELLFISQRTVEAHLQNIYRKCDVSNRVELSNLCAKYSRTE